MTGKSSGLGWVDCGVHTDLLIQHEKLTNMSIWDDHFQLSLILTKVQERNGHNSSLYSKEPFLVTQIAVIYFILKYFC